MPIAPRLENMPDVLTVKQVARVLQVSPRHIYVMVEQKQIPAIRLGRSIRVPKKAVEKMLEDVMKEA